MKSKLSHALTIAAGTAPLLLLTACNEYGYPTLADAVCGVSGMGCRPECHAVAMPAVGTDPNAVSYQLGPTSCPARTISEAWRDAEQACQDRGLALASTAPVLTPQPAAGPLAPAQTATFHCQG
jgi:hypothetical protein